VIALLINLMAFAAVFLAIFGVNWILVDLRDAERRRLKGKLDEQLRKEQRQRLNKDFSDIAAEAMADDDSQKTLLERAQFFVEQSGLHVTVSRLATIACGLALLIGLLTFLLTHYWAYAAIGAVVGLALPAIVVNYRRSKRLAALREQLPDAFELMARVLRSGQTITQAIQAVAQEFSAPISLEFLYCYEQMNLGLEQEAAMRHLGRRTGLLEIKIFVLAVLVHRQTGGNLAELLDKLGSVVRERFRIQGMIESLTAQGRLQAAILLSLPPFMFVLLMIIAPHYERTLLDYPKLIMMAMGMMFLGWLWIRRVIHFDY
jgi:tight adherence protein B